MRSRCPGDRRGGAARLPRPHWSPAAARAALIGGGAEDGPRPPGGSGGGCGAGSHEALRGGDPGRQDAGEALLPGQGGAQRHRRRDQEPLQQVPPPVVPGQTVAAPGPQGEVPEGRGCAAEPARGHHGHLLLPGPGRPDQLGDGLPHRVRRPPPHLPALLLPRALPLRPPLRLHLQQARRRAPGLRVSLVPLREAAAGDPLRAPLLPRHHAAAQHLQELHLLLGLRRLDGLLHQPPAVHATRLRRGAGEAGARRLPVLPAGELLHPRGPAQPAPRRLQDPQDPLPDPQPLHLALPARLLPQLHLRGGVLDRLHHHDAVSARGPLLAGGLRADDHLGQGQAPQLPPGVPRLPAAALAHRPLPPLSPGDTAGTGPPRPGGHRLLGDVGTRSLPPRRSPGGPVLL